MFYLLLGSMFSIETKFSLDPEIEGSKKKLIDPLTSQLGITILETYFLLTNFILVLYSREKVVL